MTVTDTLGHRPDGWWTIDDLDRLPDDGMRYELADGCLLVSPPPSLHHGGVMFLLRRLLDHQAPEELAVSNDLGILMNSRYSYFVPDLFVIPRSVFDSDGGYLAPGHVRLAVEILSAHNRGRDLVLKRHYYASVGIPRYWIVDPRTRTLTVLALSGSEYEEEAVVEAGTTYTAAEPFPIELDPAEFCQHKGQYPGGHS